VSGPAPARGAPAAMAPLRRLRQIAQGLALRTALPFLVKRRALPDLLRALDDQAGAGAGAGEETRRLAERLFRPLRLWPTTCLYRALGSYALLRAAGQEVRFLIGVSSEGGDLSAHAWLERDGVPIVSQPGPGRRFAIAYAWPADPGTLREPASPVPAHGISPSPDVVVTELEDGSGVLLHLQTGYYFTLNRTGVRAWSLLAAGVPDGAGLAASLASEFPEVDPGRVEADIDSLLAELARESLITVRR
jgi:hypothetical protein